MACDTSSRGGRRSNPIGAALWHGSRFEGGVEGRGVGQVLKDHRRRRRAQAPRSLARRDADEGPPERGCGMEVPERVRRKHSSSTALVSATVPSMSTTARRRMGRASRT